MKKQPIAIIGGMGPEASAYLYSMLIKQSISLFNAVNNDDFPEILLYSIPVPDFISNNDRKLEALEILKEKIKNINNINSLCIAIACNTAHILLNNLQEVSNSPFISMIEEVVKLVEKDGFTKIGLLGTPSTTQSGIYQDAFEKIGVEVITPNNLDLNSLEEIIRKVIAGTIKEKDKQNLEMIANTLKKNGTECIVLGCTELPLIFPTTYSIPVYNSLEILSIALLKEYYKQKI